MTAVKQFYILTAMNNVPPPSRPRGRPREFDRDEALEQARRLAEGRAECATALPSECHSVEKIREAVLATNPTDLR